MLFNSLTFVAFFAIVVALHQARWSWRQKKINLLVASYLFYAAWNPPFVILLWISTLVDWHIAKAIFAEENTRRRRLLLAVSVLVNLGILGFFKYGEFLLDNWLALLATFGLAYEPPTWSIVLPVGISFYTFQTMAYSLDIYLRRAAPSKSFLDFALFVTFFPQLVAGPIVRPTHLIPQFAEPRKANGAQMTWGLGLLTLGLFQKVVIADGALAPAADAAFGATDALTPLDAWLGTLAFSGQIFSDFAGYSTAAIGVALTLGFSLPNNFRFSVRGDRVLGLLASLAHQLIDVVARLSLYPARRQPQGFCAHVRQSDGHDAARWPVARCELDVRLSGAVCMASIWQSSVCAAFCSAMCAHWNRCWRASVWRL